jgi:hypothetical protein
MSNFEASEREKNPAISNTKILFLRNKTVNQLLSRGSLHMNSVNPDLPC